MKRTIVAILAFAPAMLVAQSQTPAQPSSTPSLQSALLQPARLTDLRSGGSASSNGSALRISTGIVAPAIVYSAPFPAAEHPLHTASVDRTIVVDLTVNEEGLPTDVHLDKGANPILAERVIASVSQFRFKPGTLDGQPAAVPVQLKYTLTQGSSY